MTTILPKFYYINLERANDREIHMKKFFKKLRKKTDFDVRYQRIDALDASKEDLSKYSNLNIDMMYHRRHTLQKATPVEFAVCYSHIKAMKQFVDDKDNTDEFAFICEDDLDLFKLDKDFFKNLLNETIEKAKECEIISLACVGSPNLLLEILPNVKNHTYLSFSENKGKLYGAACYIISKKLAKDIVGRFWKDNQFIIPVNHNSMVADHFIYPNARNASFLIPSLFTLRQENDSYIHPEHLPMHERVQKILFLMWHKIGVTK